MEKRDWKPKNTKVIVLGLGLEDWDNPDDAIGHRDEVLHKFFKKCGVPAKNNIHIRNEKGDYDSMVAFLPDFLAESDEETLFIFYYAGHGDVVADSEQEYDLQFCHPSEDAESLTLTDLIEAIEENFEGTNVLLMADCCCSGNIARFAATTESEYAYAGLTSSLASKSSTGNWTFTDCILEALQGINHIDADENGTISLQELADYVKVQMKEVENQKADFGFGEYFDCHMRLGTSKA